MLPQTKMPMHNKCGDALSFENETQLNSHFQKHGKEFGGMYNTPKEYLDGANYVIKNGKYVPEMNGYVRFFGANGGANYAFVGLKGSYISTFGVRSVKTLTRIPWLQ